RSVEYSIRVILLEAARRVDAPSTRPLRAPAVHDGPRGIGGPVAAVRARGEEDDVVLVPEGDRGGQCRFLTASALPLPVARHGGLAACHQAGGRPPRAPAPPP